MKGSWLHTMDNAGRTPLDRAFACGTPTLANTMLRQEKTDCMGNVAGPPLHRATGMNLVSAIRSLLQSGANARSRDAQGETALHRAVRGGHQDAARLLLQEGNADANATCDCGMTPLHWASITGNAFLFELLLDHGADPWVRAEYLDGLCPLEIVAQMGYDELVALAEEKLAVA